VAQTAAKLAIEPIFEADLRPGNNRPWEAVRDRLNRKLRGWTEYFKPGSRDSAYRVIDEYVEG
jgi:Group II intron, maturase-specific domain